MSARPPRLSVSFHGFDRLAIYSDSVSFTAIFVWCGFQTGNSVQLALALARLFSGPAGSRDTSFHLADQQALTSVLTFIAGASLGRIGDRMGPKTRAWLFLGTMIQALFTMAAALTAWKSGQGSIAEVRGDPAWTDALTFVAIAFMSASLGLQGIMGKRVNTQFATTSECLSISPRPPTPIHPIHPRVPLSVPAAALCRILIADHLLL